MTKGKYIVIEGPEGVGKTTQLHELARRLQAAGLPVRTLREPDSQSDLTARAIRQLTQDPRYPMNTRTEVLLYNAARAQSLEVIRQSIEHGVICLVDRNYLTTLAIQYYGRGDVPDYQTINSIISFAVGDMEPDLCILLDAPVNVLHERLAGRYNGERFDNLSDEFLERVRAGYLWEAHQRKLPVIFATDSQEQVADNIWKLVSDSLAVRESLPSSAAAAATPTSVKDIIEQKKLPDTSSRDRGESIQSDTSVIGDNKSSMHQASILQIELSGVSYLSASYFTEPSVGGMLAETDDGYSYYVPGHFAGEVIKKYELGMKTIFDCYDQMLKGLVSYLSKDPDARQTARNTLRTVLPLATNTSIQFTVRRQQLESLVTNLLSQDMPEPQQLGQSLQQQNDVDSKAEPGDDEQLDRSEVKAQQLQKAAQQIKTLATKHLPDTYATATEPVTLVDFWPKNELLLVPDMLYTSNNQSLERLQSEVSAWPYDRKSAIFKAYFGQQQQLGPALEKAHYSWDLVSDYTSFLELQQQAQADDLGCQAPTPRYGYDIPKLIEDAGLIGQFEECFDTSLKLHSYLNKAGHPLEAGYAVLMGHKLRWKATYNARQLFRLLETANYYSTPDSIKVVTLLQEKLTEAHPVTAESIILASQS